MASINSMTAFARGEAGGEPGTVVVELRSVNHRYLDGHFKLPDELRRLEPRLRDAFATQLNRGKVDCALKFQEASSRASLPELDETLLARVIDAGERIARRLNSDAGIDPMAVLQYPGVVKPAELDNSALQSMAMQAFNNALESLVAARAGEGAQLVHLLEQRLDAISAQTQSVRDHLPTLQKRLRERLQQRLDALAIEVDSGRLEQELVYLAQKSDVEEEIDRIDTHVQAVRQALAAGGPCGRRLDFLMQELNREANTLSSKSTDSGLTASAVELKVLIEQMREQVQNIE
ncbi:MAG: YicC/YloC family endoribonuclease [Chromatocurvus sp.]